MMSALKCIPRKITVENRVLRHCILYAIQNKCTTQYAHRYKHPWYLCDRVSGSCTTLWVVSSMADTVKHSAKQGKTKKTRTPFTKRHLALLHALYHGTPIERKALLKKADKGVIKCICECALNILRGVVNIKASAKKHLKKYKNTLRTLASSTKCVQRGRGWGWKAKKRIILQKGCGGFLGLLLAPIIDTLLGKLFSGRPNTQ